MSEFWYAFHAGDYAKKTAHLTMIEHGAYRLLLDHYYNSGPMVANAKQLLHVCRAVASEEQAALLSILDQFFVLRDGHYHNKRCDEELKKRANIRKMRAKAGKKGGQANAKQLPTQLQLQSQLQLKKESTNSESVDSSDKLIGPRKIARTSARGTRWDPDRVVSQDWIEEGMSYREAAKLPAIDLRLQAEMFQNFWVSKSGSNAVKLNWHRTWLNWCINAKGQANGKPKLSDHPLGIFGQIADELRD